MARLFETKARHGAKVALLPVIIVGLTGAAGPSVFWGPRLLVPTENSVEIGQTKIAQKGEDVLTAEVYAVDNLVLQEEAAGSVGGLRFQLAEGTVLTPYFAYFPNTGIAHEYAFCGPRVSRLVADLADFPKSERKMFGNNSRLCFLQSEDGKTVDRFFVSGGSKDFGEVMPFGSTEVSPSDEPAKMEALVHLGFDKVMSAKGTAQFYVHMNEEGTNWSGMSLLWLDGTTVEKTPWLLQAHPEGNGNPRELAEIFGVYGIEVSKSSNRPNTIEYSITAIGEPAKFTFQAAPHITYIYLPVYY